MAKRFIETDLFDDEWFSSLSKDGKIFFIYFITKCNHAGILKLNKGLASYQLGINPLERVIEELGNRLVTLTEGTYLMPKFLFHQYPKFPQSAVKAQDSAIKLLKQYGISVEKLIELSNPYLTLSKPLPKDYDNDNDNDNGFEKKIGGMGERKKTDFLSSNQLFERCDIHHKLPKGTAKQYAAVFIEMLEATDRFDDMPADELKRYFYNWIPATFAKMQKSAPQKTKAEEVSDHFDRIREQMVSDPEKFFTDGMKAYLKPQPLPKS